MDSRLIPLADSIKNCVGQNPERRGDPIVLYAPKGARADVRLFCWEVHGALVDGNLYWGYEQAGFLSVLSGRQKEKGGHSVVLVGADSMPPKAMLRLTSGDYIRPSLLLLVIFSPLTQLCGTVWPSNIHEHVLGSFSWPLA